MSEKKGFFLFSFSLSVHSLLHSLSLLFDPRKNNVFIKIYFCLRMFLQGIIDIGSKDTQRKEKLTCYEGR